MGITIKEAQLIEKLNEADKLPISDGSNIPKSVSIGQIKEFTNKDIPPPDVSNQISEALKDYVKKEDGKGLSANDFTNLLKEKLDSLSNYDDTEINQAVTKLREDFDTLVSGDTTTAIKTFNEIIDFLDGISDSTELSSIISSIEQQIATKQAIISDLDAIRQGAAKGATALQVEQYTGTYSKPSGGIPKSDLESAVQDSLNKADTALQSHQDISGKINGDGSIIKIVKVTSLPSAPDTNTLYIIV